MKIGVPEKQPVGAYYYLVLKISLIILAMSFFMAVFSGNILRILVNFIAYFVVIGIPYLSYAKLKFDNFIFVVSDEKITIESGIFSKETTTSVYNLIKDVIVSEPMLARIFGIAKIKYIDRVVPMDFYLNKEDAKKLQELISSKMSASRLALVENGQ